MGLDNKNLIFDKGRLEALTDGVFAIIMTILVFNIVVPELKLFAEGDYASERLAAKFADLWPEFLAYVISFSTLGAFWVAHHRVFRWILYVNRPLIWINISFLMIIGLIPFSTTLLTQYFDSQNSIFVFSSNAILAGLLIYSIYYYVKHNTELVDSSVQVLIEKSSSRRVLAMVLTYSVSIIFSFIYLPLSIFLLLLVLVPEIIPDKYFGKKTT
ncbi:MAG TPA: TMEM175 family protein [Candidatus Nitrosocosmicus sp.]|nr:TMEM175 family protein [Candidatus Nitrosocosmicus sp.]